MQEWEYKVVNVGEKAYQELETVEKILNVYQDWELVSVENGTAYFKRPVIVVRRRVKEIVARLLSKK